MRPRHDITAIFSTFLQWSEERFSGWVADPKLHRSMEKHLAQSAEAGNSVNDWALYWHKNWQVQTHPLAEAHLSSYLQESAFWAARKISTRFASQQYPLSDCFQIALFALGRILRGFNPDLGTKLQDYAQVSFRSFIRDTLRQRWETDLCSNWSLLRKLSQKRLTESLAQVGLSDREIARYQLAWKCFKDLYAPTRNQGMRQLAKPTAETWEAIAKAYNAERRRQLTEPGEECSPAILVVCQV